MNAFVYDKYKLRSNDPCKKTNNIIVHKSANAFLRPLFYFIEIDFSFINVKLCFVKVLFEYYIFDRSKKRSLLQAF